jgi:phosphatidylglycerophosphate synthase
MNGPVVGVNRRTQLQAFWRGDFSGGGPPPTKYLVQPLSGVIAFVAFTMGLPAYVVTLIGTLLGLVGGYALALGEGSVALGGLLLFFVAYMFDCADGQVARAGRSSSRRGAWLDVCSDYLTITALGFAVLVNLSKQTVVPVELALSAALLFTAARVMSLFTATLIRGQGGLQLPQGGAMWVLRRGLAATVDAPTIIVILALTMWEPALLASSASFLGILIMAHAIGAGLRATEPAARK